jgi:hypothetical protein
MFTSNFFAELKRRNVYKVAVAYVVAGWALAQGIAQVFPIFDVPTWIIRLMLLLIIIGFPFALIFAWTFEITAEGVKRTAEADAMPRSARLTNRTWIYVVVVGAAISTGQGCSSSVATRLETEQRGRAIRNPSPSCRSPA